MVRCDEYSESRPAVERALELSGLAQKLRGRRVFLKVNLMKGAPREKRVNTDPEFVGALTAALADLGCAALVGDSTGVLGFTSEAMAASGISAAVERAGGRTVNLDAGPFTRVSIEGEVFDSFQLPSILFEVDDVVVVPKLKTHTLTGMTCALKNLVGTLPGGSKCEIHLRAPTPIMLSQAICDLCLAVRPAGAVVDAVWGLAGQGKFVGPRPTKAGMILAGEDCAAVDVVCADAVGLDPARVPTIAAAAERGLGPASIADVEIVGDDLAHLRVSFKPAGFEPKRLAFLARLYYRIRGRSIRPRHLPERCSRCGRCVGVCPVGALEWQGDRIVVGSDCIRCFACHEVCEDDAMPLTCPWWLKPFFRGRAEGLDTSKLT